MSGSFPVPTVRQWDGLLGPAPWAGPSPHARRAAAGGRAPGSRPAPHRSAPRDCAPGPVRLGWPLRSAHVTSAPCAGRGPRLGPPRCGPAWALALSTKGTGRRLLHSLLAPRAGLPLLSSGPGSLAVRRRPLCGGSADAHDRLRLREAPCAQRDGTWSARGGAAHPGMEYLSPYCVAPGGRDSVLCRGFSLYLRYDNGMAFLVRPRGPARLRMRAAPRPGDVPPGSRPAPHRSAPRACAPWPGSPSRSRDLRAARRARAPTGPAALRAGVGSSALN